MHEIPQTFASLRADIVHFTFALRLHLFLQVSSCVNWPSSCKFHRDELHRRLRLLLKQLLINILRMNSRCLSSSLVREIPNHELLQDTGCVSTSCFWFSFLWLLLLAPCHVQLLRLAFSLALMDSSTSQLFTHDHSAPIHNATILERVELSRRPAFEHRTRNATATATRALDLPL